MITRSDIDPETGEIFPFLRSGFNYDRDAASIATGLLCCDPSLTQQQFADEADINTIVKRFGLTGQLPENGTAPVYSDFDDVVDYHTAMIAVRRAEEAFLALPGAIRYDKFNNDPQRFVAFCSDPINLPELRELGLANPLPPEPKKPEPVPAPGTVLS